jgi:hypothetical protein
MSCGGCGSILAPCCRISWRPRRQTPGRWHRPCAETKELVEWVETQLLAEVEQRNQLRFLIGGQKVPERAACWRDLAEEMELDGIDDQQAWKDWIQQQKLVVRGEYVEHFVLGLDGVPGTISSALTTIAKH